MVSTSTPVPTPNRLRSTSPLKHIVEEPFTNFHQANPLACCFFITINSKNNVSQGESFVRAAVNQHKLANLPQKVLQDWSLDYLCAGVETHSSTRHISRLEFINKLFHHRIGSMKQSKKRLDDYGFALEVGVWWCVCGNVLQSSISYRRATRMKSVTGWR